MNRLANLICVLMVAVPLPAIAGPNVQCKDADGAKSIYASSFDERFVQCGYQTDGAEVAMFADCKSFKAIAADDPGAYAVVRAVMFATAKSGNPTSLKAVMSEIERLQLPARMTTIPKNACVCSVAVLQKSKVK
jgi:hypothetical protein